MSPKVAVDPQAHQGVIRHSAAISIEVQSISVRSFGFHIYRVWEVQRNDSVYLLGDIPISLSQEFPKFPPKLWHFEHIPILQWNFHCFRNPETCVAHVNHLQDFNSYSLEHKWFR